MAASTVIPTPPRLDLDPNDPASVGRTIEAIHKFLGTFHQATVGEAKLLNPFFQADAGTFDAANLPDPASTSIAKAQDVANRAYEAAAGSGGAGSVAAAAEDAAAAAQATADAALALATSLVKQTLTISDLNTTGVFTFDTAHPDANYPVRLEPVSFTGAASPPLLAFVPTVTAKTVNDFTISIGAAPGTGCSVTFELVLRL